MPGFLLFFLPGTDLVRRTSSVGPSTIGLIRSTKPRTLSKKNPPGRLVSHEPNRRQPDRRIFHVPGSPLSIGRERNGTPEAPEGTQRRVLLLCVETTTSSILWRHKSKTRLCVRIVRRSPFEHEPNSHQEQPEVCLRRAATKHRNVEHHHKTMNNKKTTTSNKQVHTQSLSQ